MLIDRFQRRIYILKRIKVSAIGALIFFYLGILFNTLTNTYSQFGVLRHNEYTRNLPDEIKAYSANIKIP